MNAIKIKRCNATDNSSRDAVLSVINPNVVPSINLVDKFKQAEKQQDKENDTKNNKQINNDSRIKNQTSEKDKDKNISCITSKKESRKQ